MKPILTASLWMAIACLWVQPAFPAVTETQVGKTVDISAFSATALLRAKTPPGVIRVKTYVPRLKSGDAQVVYAAKASDFDAAFYLGKRKRAGVHTVFCRRPVKPSFNRKNGAPVLMGTKNLAHPVPPASGF